MFNQFSQIDNLFTLPVVISGLIGSIFLLLALSQMYKKKIIKCCIQSIFATLFLGVAIVLLLLGMNLYTYQRLTKEEDIAKIEFWASGPQQYLAELSIQGNEQQQSFLLYGDEWQIDARIIKWTTPAILVGLDTRYRLERLSGRYKDTNKEINNARSVFKLSTEPGLNVWPLIAKLQYYVNWFDTYYGNSVYLPMADQAIFEIVLTQSGILARPKNLQAKRSVQEW